MSPRIDPNIEELNALEQRVERLRVQYEKYFLGIDKRAPQSVRDALRRDLIRLRERHLKGSAAKFKLDNLQTKIHVYEQYWDRVVKQIEEGTYYRDRYKLDLKRELQEKQVEAAAAAAPPPRPPQESVLEYFGLNEKRLEKIHQSYLQARAKHGDASEALTPEQLAVSLTQDLAELRKAGPSKQLEFRLKLRAGQIRVHAVAPGEPKKTE